LKNSNIKIGSNKNFGIVFSFFFFLVAIYIFYKSENINFILIFLSILFLTLGIINSKILTPLNFLWFKFGIILSKIVSPIIMMLIFFIVVTPLALLAKLVKKDFLELDKKKNKKKQSYWIKKEKYNNSMKDQF
jgi:hypothetical protein|tara:strand:- start:376 stop:774 length:399 start_codon:yes stop_codon:yes gene_type:complete